MFVYLCVYYFFLDKPQFALMKLYNIRAVFFNRGSASGCRGFSRKRPKLHGTNFATAVLCGCSNTDTCMWFHEQRKHLRKVPLEQNGWKTLHQGTVEPCKLLKRSNWLQKSWHNS